MTRMLAGFPAFAGLRLGFIILASALIGGCDAASPYRGIIRDQTRAWEEMEKILAGVVDQDSMGAARKELAALQERYQAIVERVQGLPDPSPEIRQQVGEDAEKLRQAVVKANEQIRRINSLPGGPEFLGRLPGK